MLGAEVAMRHDRRRRRSAGCDGRGRDMRVPCLERRIGRHTLDAVEIDERIGSCLIDQLDDVLPLDA
jgi:hypothetical protein